MAIDYREGPIDVARVAALRDACGFAARSAEEIAQQLVGARWVVSAWDGPNLIGMARAISDGITNAYVSSVMVAEAWRGKGIGRALMRRMMDGRPSTMRWVLHSRESSVEFYRALGFVPASGMMRASS